MRTTKARTRRLLTALILPTVVGAALVTGSVGAGATPSAKAPKNQQAIVIGQGDVELVGLAAPALGQVQADQAGVYGGCHVAAAEQQAVAGGVVGHVI